MIDEKTVREFFRRVHGPYGLTELVALDHTSGRIAAVGYFDDECLFVQACKVYNQRCNVYAGRNPRPFSICSVPNVMDTIQKKRAKDSDIKFVTAMSLDIDPVREKGKAATRCQRKEAIGFAMHLHRDLGGWVDVSGNGVYLWFKFETALRITPDNADKVKQQCRTWQENLKLKYKPEKYDLRIDGCYDFSRIKRVIGTTNHKGGRCSRQVKSFKASDEIRSQILASDISFSLEKKRKLSVVPSHLHFQPLPLSFRSLMEKDTQINNLWSYPPIDGDRSRHDWVLGLRCIEAGITDPQDLAAILLRNPYGKFRRDMRDDYVERTVIKLIETQETNRA